MIQSAKIRPGADCGSDHELLIAKFQLKLKKVGKTIRPFRYDLNQVPDKYMVEVRNRFKGLDLIECLKNYGQRFVTFPGGSEVKASACNVGDLGSIPGSGRSPVEGNGNSFQYSCLENPMDRGAWWATVHGVTKSRTRLSDFTFLVTLYRRQ